MEYDDRFVPGASYYNSVTPFSALIFENFYKDVFDNNFEHILDRTKYSSFINWVVGEVL